MSGIKIIRPLPLAEQRLAEFLAENHLTLVTWVRGDPYPGWVAAFEEPAAVPSSSFCGGAKSPSDAVQNFCESNAGKKVLVSTAGSPREILIPKLTHIDEALAQAKEGFI